MKGHYVILSMQCNANMKLVFTYPSWCCAKTKICMNKEENNTACLSWHDLMPIFKVWGGGEDVH